MCISVCVYPEYFSTSKVFTLKLIPTERRKYERFAYLDRYSLVVKATL